MDYRNTGLVISGDTWIDTGYRHLETSEPDPNLVGEARLFQEGRLNLRATPTFTYDEHWFVKAQAELLAHAENRSGGHIADTDDAWVKIGYWDLFDIQLGRFEAWEVYHKGLGLERYTLEDQGATPTDEPNVQGAEVDIYEVNYAMYRQDSFGQIAAHLFPAGWARMELGAVIGSRDDDVRIGARPVGILDFDFVKVKVGGEFVDQFARTRGFNADIETRVLRSGFGAGVVGILAPHVEGGANMGLGRVSTRDASGTLVPQETYDHLSFGGFLNASLGLLTPALAGTMLGGGANYTELVTDDCGLKPLTNPDGTPVVTANGQQYAQDVCGLHSHVQVFGAIQQALFDRAIIKLVVSAAQVDYTYGPSDARLDSLRTAYGTRLRALVWY
jgi:hypothetical protein